MDRPRTRRTIIGVVKSNGMQKSVVVQIERLELQPKYKKYIKRRKRYKAHDSANDCNVGDQVLIEESRPLSKDKRWRLVEVTKKVAR